MSTDPEPRLLPGTQLPLAGLVHLTVLYFAWGSTYLAIRLAVREGTGFPPFAMAGMRVLAASLLLLAWARMRNRPLRPSGREWLVLFGTGMFMWLGGNGLVTWAEQRADSGYAALIVGALPIYVALMEAIVDRRPPTWRLMGGLALGFAGLALLSWPTLRGAEHADVLSLVALLLAPLSWGIGSLIMVRRPVSLGPGATSGWQQLLGAGGFLVVSLLVREPTPTPTPEAWGAWVYLTLVGSVIAFTSFMVALRSLPTSLVMTYAYVNPVVAVLLGALLLDERLTLPTLAGAVLVLLGVAGVFEDRRHTRPEA